MTIEFLILQRRQGYTHDTPSVEMIYEGEVVTTVGKLPGLQTNVGSRKSRN